MDTTSSLNEVVKQVTQQQQSQASGIQRNRKVLSQFQTELSELEAELKSLLLETKEIDQKISQEEGAIEHIILQSGAQETQIHSIHAENIKRKLDLETKKEDFVSILSRNNEYRKRIADSSYRFSVAENKLPFKIELIKKRDTVSLLKRQKEEMILDLHNPGSAAVKQVQEEILSVSQEIKAIGQSISAKKKFCEEEKETHAVLRKEIEVQKKRYDAILKRLHSQLNKVQLNRRQYQWNIEQMEKTASSLRESLGIMQ